MSNVGVGVGVVVVGGIVVDVVVEVVTGSEVVVVVSIAPAAPVLQAVTIIPSVINTAVVVRMSPILETDQRYPALAIRSVRRRSRRDEAVPF